MVLGNDGATCVSTTLELDTATIEPVDTIIDQVQSGAEGEKVPEVEHQPQPQEPEVDPDLQQAVEVLKEKQEQKNLYTGLVIGLIAGVGILSLLVSKLSLETKIMIVIFSGGNLGLAPMCRGFREPGEPSQTKHSLCEGHLLTPQIPHRPYIRV